MLLRIIIVIAFCFNCLGPLPSAWAADTFRLPAPGVRVSLSPPFNPPILKGIKVHTDNPFRFDFILDTGDSHPIGSVDKGGQLNSTVPLSLKDESTKLIKYFLASLTTPEADLWVNLSPYEKNKIIPKSFGQTEMGRDLLAEDYMLKQITASLIYPEEEFGKRFWKKVYEEAAKQYGTASIPVNTFNKVWIVPERAIVYENAKAGTAYVVESKLKVMLEQDYLALQKSEARNSKLETNLNDQMTKNSKRFENSDLGHSKIASNIRTFEDSNINTLGFQIVREIVIPELTKEVNEGANFAQLRQVYNSLILATWYKKKIKDSILSQVYADKNKVAGVGYTSSVIAPTAALRQQGVGARNDTSDVEAIYQRYLKAFKKGVYNYIKEEQDPVTQETIPRKYFSGGLDMAMTVSNYGLKAAFQTITDPSRVPVESLTNNTVLIEENTIPATTQGVISNITTPPIDSGREIIPPVISPSIVDRASVSTGKAGKAIPGAPLKLQNEYNRDAERKERFLKDQDVVNRFIAPGKEDFEKFQPLYNEVRSIIDRLLVAQGLNPKEFQFFLADTMDPNAYVLNYYNTIVVNLGLIRMLAEYAKANNIDVTQDALAWVLSHEILHIMQNRREIDEGRMDEKKGLVDRHAEDRGKEYQSDLLALWLMDRGGFTVKAAPHVLEGIDHWLKARGEKDAVWGTHPQIEERVRKLEYQILTYHWQNQDARASTFNSIATSEKRTRFREFQERVIGVTTASDLIALLNEAKSIDELQFGMLIGFELLPAAEKNSQQQVQAVFEQASRKFAGEDKVKQILYDYMQDEIYIMLGFIPDDLSTRLDGFKKLGQRLSVETILQIFDLEIPNLFSLTVNVDKLQKTDRHGDAETVLSRLSHSVTSMGGRQRPSDRFNMYSTGFLYGMYTRLISDAGNGSLELSQIRRFLLAILNLQNSRGYFDSMRFTKPLIEMVAALEDSPHYRSQLTSEDIKLIIQIKEILGSKINYQLNAEPLAKSLYELAQGVSADARNVIIEWLLNRDGGWNGLRAEFLKLDIETMFKQGRGIVFQGNRIEYLENLLANDNIVKNMQDVLKVFAETSNSDSNQVSAEELVIIHKKIFRKFKEKHINNDLKIFFQLWIRTRHNADMFAGDTFDRVLSENVPAELQPLLKGMRRELKPILYMFVLGGIPSNKDFRDFIFGATRVREREEERFFANQQIEQMINSLPVRRGSPKTFESAEKRYNYLEYDDRNKVHDLWNQINPERRIENLNNEEFGVIKQVLEYYRHSLGEGLSEVDSTVDQQEKAFGQYAAPVYLQALFVELGQNTRLNEDDVGYSSNAWDIFGGDISTKGLSDEADYVKLASKQRPENAVRYMKENIAFDDFVGMFNFISLLPDNFEDAVNAATKAIPPSVFRNFLLHMIFVNRILIKEAGYPTDNNSILDFRKMQVHIDGLSSDKRGKVLAAIAAIAPNFVHDDVMENSNRGAIAAYWRDRYSKNAPKLDEIAIRQQHDQENNIYDDMTYSTPGGPVAQLYVFISRLADNEMKNTLASSELSLASKREMIEKYYPQSSLARDRWIKAAIQAEGTDKTVDQTEKLLAMIYNHELRDNLALGAFDQYRTEHPGDFEFLSDTLDHIQRFFPEASLIRDDVLAETAQYLAKTREPYEQVRKLYLDPFKKTKDLDIKKTARIAMNQDIFRTWMTNRSPSEKSHFLLWLMGVTNEKPFFLVDFEYNFHVNADSLREDFGRRQSKYYPLAGQSSQREAIEPFLYGEKGIFNDATAMSNLLNGMFDFLIKDGPNKTILKKVFDKVFEKANQSRREEIFLSLVWTLSLQRGEMQNTQQNITPDRQEARAVRMFLESLGLVGRQLAQVLARSLWVTPVMRDELALVQDSARRMDKGVVFDMLEKFGLSDQFESIEEPLGSAKVAGVYRAKKRDGKIVAIKVKRPEVDKTIETDMKFLKDVFDDDLKAAFMAEGIIIPDNFITQIEEGFRQELDFKQEAKNTAELGARVQRSVLKKMKEFSLRKLFGDARLGDVQGDYEFYVPQIMEVVNNSLIIMEYIDGVKLSSERQVQKVGLNQSDIELAVANELLREIFYEGFYHGDPHLGNILIQKLENGRVRIILIDAGASFSINKTNRRMLGKLMIAVRDSQSDVLEGVVQQLGGTLNEDIRRELIEQVLGSKDSVGQKLLWFFHILEENHVQIPNELLQIMRFFATGQALFNRGDSAMINEVEKEQAVDLDRVINQGTDEVAKRGGIDFTANKTPLEIQNAGEGIKFHLDPAMLQQLQNAPGFYPVIINITPMNSLKEFLGINEGGAPSLRSG